MFSFFKRKKKQEHIELEAEQEHSLREREEALSDPAPVEEPAGQTEATVSLVEEQEQAADTSEAQTLPAEPVQDAAVPEALPEEAETEPEIQAGPEEKPLSVAAQPAPRQEEKLGWAARLKKGLTK
ncbi:signal recognition particle-docking protein FtsY, partial [Neisseria zoodegmatis]